MKKTLTAAIAAALIAAPVAGFAQNTADPSLEAMTGPVELSLYTHQWPGHWMPFFGIKICAGQRFDVPGESQCV